MIDRCHQIKSRPGTPQEILLKHTQQQYDTLKAMDNETNEKKLEDLSAKYHGIYVHPVNFMNFFSKFVQKMFIKFYLVNISTIEIGRWKYN